MKKGKLFADLTLIAAVLLLAAVLVAEVCGVHQLHENVLLLDGKEPTGDAPVTVFFSDRMLAELGYGTDDPEMTMEEFLNGALRNIDARIMAAGLVYTAAVTALLACWLERRFGKNAGKHIAAVVVSTVCVYLLFLVTVFGTMLVLTLPVFLPTGQLLPALIVGLLSVMAGGCAVALCLRSVKAKPLVGILVLVLVLITYLFGSLCEMGLFIAPASDEFTRFTGLGYAAGVVGELVNPYSGMTLPLIRHASELRLPVLAIVLYLVRNALWIALPALRKRPIKGKSVNP